MSLNRNKSNEILLQLDLKVFLLNTIRGWERETWSRLKQHNKHISKLLSMLMKTPKKLPERHREAPKHAGELLVVSVPPRGLSAPNLVWGGSENIVFWPLCGISHHPPFCRWPIDIHKDASFLFTWVLTGLGTSRGLPGRPLTPGIELKLCIKCWPCGFSWPLFCVAPQSSEQKWSREKRKGKGDSY